MVISKLPKSSFLVFLGSIAFAMVVAVVPSSAQVAPDEVLRPARDARDQPRTLRDFVARQRSEKARRDHEELLKRGDEAVALAEELETAFMRDNRLSPNEIAKLETLEKLISRIRKGLGGEGDGDGLSEDIVEKRQPLTVENAVVDLKDLTIKLVDEMKKTSRFTVSVIAIQSSNSVLQIVKFLRLRK